VPRSYPWFKTEGENGPASEEPRRPDAHGCIMVWMIEDDTSIILHRIQGCWRRWPLRMAGSPLIVSWSGTCVDQLAEPSLRNGRRFLRHAEIFSDANKKKRS
jgi:hypothetical protein